MESLLVIAPKSEFDKPLKEIETDRYLCSLLLKTGNVGIVSAPDTDLDYTPKQLMELREKLGGTGVVECHTNNLKIDNYSTQFCVVRGDPDPETIQKLERLGTYSKNGKIIKGKMRKLEGNPGWLIPLQNKQHVESLVNERLPESLKIKKCGESFVEKRVKEYTKLARKVSDLRGAQTVETKDVYYIVSGVQNNRELLASESLPPVEYTKLVEKIGGVDKSAGRLLYSVIEHELNDCLRSDMSFEETQEALDSVHFTYPEFQTREEFLEEFFRVRELLQKGVSEKTKDASVCIIALDLILGDSVSDSIKKEYSAKSHSSKIDSTDEPVVFRDRFGFRFEDLEALLEYFDKLGMNDQKSKLLVLTAVQKLNLEPGELLVLGGEGDENDEEDEGDDGEESGENDEESTGEEGEEKSGENEGEEEKEENNGEIEEKEEESSSSMEEY